MTEWEVKTFPLDVPSLLDVATTLSDHLKSCFNQVDVGVVECPDLRQAPFHLAGSGLNGRPAICDVGGVPYLVPLAQTNKAPYSMKWISSRLNYTTSFMVGAAAGPHHVVGTNSELMPNFGLSGGETVNETHRAKLDETSSQGYDLKKVPAGCDEFCLLGNLFLSEGKGGPVIRVNVKGRRTADNFVTAMRSGLKAKFASRQVSIGGVFLIKSGKAKVHVMPAFSETPLDSDQQVNQWLRYFEASAPLICLTAFHSVDPGQDLRIEHTHCFSTHGEGGHYHYDTTPDTVEYEAYLNVASTIYRIDAPKETHQIGRD